MRTLLQSNKLAVSEIIAYVLLITIAVSLSILVYNWLRFYVQVPDDEGCSEGISVIIQNYECSKQIAGQQGFLNLTLKNKGRFNIDGFLLKVHDRKDAEIGLYTLSQNGSTIITSGVYNQIYVFSEVRGNSTELKSISLIEIQPFVYEQGKKIFCEKVSSQSVECN